MANGYAPLPAYRVDNAMVNFQPLNQGIAAVAKGEQQNYDRTNAAAFGNAMATGDSQGAMIAGAKIDPKLAMDAGLYPLKKTSLEQENETKAQAIEKNYRSLIGSHAQTLTEMKDPSERAAALGRWVQGEPKVAKGLERMGIDWKANPDAAIKSIYQDALGAQDPEQQKKIIAETTRALVMPAPAGTDLVGLPQAPGQTGQTIHTAGAKLNPDYEYLDPANPQAGVRPRPGGNADTKQLEKQQAARANLDATNQNLDLLLSNIRELHTPATTDDKGNVIDAGHTHPGLGGNFGLSGKVFNMPGGEASNAFAKLEQLRARGGFEALNAMRQASKTGGALGAVSDAEGKQLQNSFAALQSAQGEENVKKELAKVLRQVEMSKQRINAAYERQYNNPGPTAPGQPAQYSGSQGQAQSGPAIGNTRKDNTGRAPDAASVNESMARARDAIAKGADPQAVAKRLRDAGIDPSGLQ